MPSDELDDESSEDNCEVVETNAKGAPRAPTKKPTHTKYAPTKKPAHTKCKYALWTVTNKRNPTALKAKAKATTTEEEVEEEQDGAVNHATCVTFDFGVNRR